MAIISFTNYKRGQTTGCMGAVMRYTMQSAMVLSRGKIAFRVNRETSEKGRSEPGLCGGHSE